MSTLHYTSIGQGTPLVLLHGFPLDSGIWKQQRAGLSSRFRVITPDLRGFGSSQSTTPFTLAEQAQNVHALLADLNALPCLLGGLSMGGYVALEFASQFPADLRALLLIDTKAEADTSAGKQARDKMIQLVRDKGSKAVAEDMMPRMVAPTAKDNHPAAVRALQEIMENCPPLTIEHALTAMRERRDHTATLAQIQFPALVIVGESDVITPPAIAEAMQKALPRARLAVIPAAGHMTPMEQPEQLNSALLRFAEEMNL